MFGVPVVDGSDAIVTALPTPSQNKGKKRKIADSPPPVASTSQAQLPVTPVKRRLLHRDSLGSLSSLLPVSPVSPIATSITALLQSTAGASIQRRSTPSWDSMAATSTTRGSPNPFDLAAAKSPQAEPALAVAGPPQGTPGLTVAGPSQGTPGLTGPATAGTPLATQTSSL
jgi:hypothetical protein